MNTFEHHSLHIHKKKFLYISAARKSIHYDVRENRWVFNLDLKTHTDVDSLTCRGSLLNNRGAEYWNDLSMKLTPETWSGSIRVRLSELLSPLLGGTTHRSSLKYMGFPNSNVLNTRRQTLNTMRTLSGNQ